MTPQQVIGLVVQGLEVLLALSAPLLLSVLAIGFVISVLQAATQINEQTLSFVPKLLAVTAVLAVTGPWMISTMVAYVQRLFAMIPGVIG